MFVEKYPLHRLRPASYNPRRIDGDAFAALRRSLIAIGLAKPIVAADGTILAGHQRHRAALAEGITHGPVVLLSGVSPHDEIRFNQLHNGCEIDTGAERARVPAAGRPGCFDRVAPADIDGDMRAKGAVTRTQLADLLLRHGDWGGAVADCAGHVVSGAGYALACKATTTPLRVFRVHDGEAARRFLCRDYGVFSYGHLMGKNSWAQCWCQMNRLAGRPDRPIRSVLYERQVLPFLSRGDRVLDFGFGRGAYLTALRERRHRAWGVEFFPREGRSIDTVRARREIDRALQALARGGRFDAVVCDSVLNSVDSSQAEADVLTVVAGLCRPGGRIHLSGRHRERVDQLLKNTRASSRQRYVECCDEAGFSAIYRGGVWTFQRHHRLADARTIAAQLGTVLAFTKTQTSWQATIVKGPEPAAGAVEAALVREFNMAWPAGRTVGRGDAALRSWRAAMARETAALFDSR